MIWQLNNITRVTTWNAKMVREKTMMVVIPAAMITASVSYFMLTYFKNMKYRDERFLNNYHAQDDSLCYCEGCQQNEVDREAPEKTQLKLPHSQCRLINVTIFDLKTNMSNGSILNVSDGLAVSNSLLLLY